MTSLPADISYGRVRGRVIQALIDGADVGDEPDAVPATGVVVFTPDIDHFVDDASKTLVVPKPVRVNLDAYGEFNVLLIATNDPDLNPTGFTYTLSFQLIDASIPGFSIEVPSGSDQDLTEFIPVGQSSGVATLRGPTGDSAYDTALENGFVGTEAEWLLSLEGDPGPEGPQGISAYEVALANGFSGTEAEWLDSLQGADGADGADGATTLDELTDVDLVTVAPEDGQAIVYNATSGLWMPGTVQGGGATVGAWERKTITFSSPEPVVTDYSASPLLLGVGRPATPTISFTVDASMIATCDDPDFILDPLLGMWFKFQMMASTYLYWEVIKDSQVVQAKSKWTTTTNPFGCMLLLLAVVEGDNVEVRFWVDSADPTPSELQAMATYPYFEHGGRPASADGSRWLMVDCVGTETHPSGFFSDITSYSTQPSRVFDTSSQNYTQLGSLQLGQTYLASVDSGLLNLWINYTDGTEDSDFDDSWANTSAMTPAHALTLTASFIEIPPRPAL